MKHTIILIAMLVVCIAGASAQEGGNNDADRWSFGARAGISLSSLTNSEGGSHVGFTAEFLSDFHLKNKLYFRTGLGFNEFRHKWTSKYASLWECDGKTKCIANSVYLPLRLAWKLPVNGNCGFDLETGTYFSYGIGGKCDYCDEIVSKHNVYGRGFNNRYNFGLQCGIGFTFRRYYVGFSTMFDWRNNGDTHDGFTGAVKLGYTFK